MSDTKTLNQAEQKAKEIYELLDSAIRPVSEQIQIIVEGLEDYHLSKQVEQQPKTKGMERLSIYRFQAQDIADTLRQVINQLESTPERSCFDRNIIQAKGWMDNVLTGEIDKQVSRLRLPNVEQVEPKVSVPSDEIWAKCLDNFSSCLFNYFIQVMDMTPIKAQKDVDNIKEKLRNKPEWMRDRITSNSVPKQWISVKSGLPNHTRKVLGYNSYSDIMVDCRRYKMDSSNMVCTVQDLELGDYEETVNITHWIERTSLPTPPNTPNQE